MGVSIGLWRASIGRFHASLKTYSESKRKLSPQLFTFYVSLMGYLVSIANQCLNSKYFFGFYIMVFINLILLCGDIEENPGPKTKPDGNLSVCHWNVNSIPSHNFQKIAALESFVSMHKFDIICISETFLNNTYEDNDLNLNGYSLLRADHPSNAKRGGVCIYYKENLPLKLISTPYLNESLLCEVTIGSKKCIIGTVYRSPSQNSDEFESFLSNFEFLLQDISNRNPYLTLLLGDYNARNTNWWHHDITTTEGVQLETTTTIYGLQQLIDEPTHIRKNSSSCIDLIFANQPNLIVNKGTHPSLHENCQHQITFAKATLRVEYPPPYKRHVWNYAKANVNGINKAISQFNWQGSFTSLPINEQVNLFNSTLMNIFSNFIPNKTVTFNDQDPPWFGEKIKAKIELKNRVYKQYVKNGRPEDLYYLLQSLTSEISSYISKCKNDYFIRLGKKLGDPSRSIKTYWATLRTLWNGKKVPNIPPLLVNDELLSEFEVKANIFNKYFASQCTTINNNSVLPSTLNHLTDDKLSSFNISSEVIFQLIKNLDPNKAHGYDDISVKMLKLCAPSICKPLTLLFENCVRSGEFPNVWKRSNIVPVHKKGNKQLIKNYRPVSLLPICGKLMEKLMFNSIFNFIDTRNLLSVHQSGFRPGDSCVHQLISIVHEIYSAFDANPSLEVRGVFLDISKAFDRVWHKGLLYKLKCMGINGNLLKLVESFLSNRYQRVVLSGQASSWAEIRAGVPQGSILGPLFFLIYINDLSENLKSTVKLFADDTSIFHVVKDPNTSAEILNHDLTKISEWAYRWKMSFNPDPSKQAQEILFSNKVMKTNHPNIIFNGNTVQKSANQKHLGLILDEKLTFNDHITSKLTTVNKLTSTLRKLYHYMPRDSLVTIYKSFIRPHLDYADVIFDKPSNATFSNRIESAQYNAALAITGTIRGTSKEKLYEELGFETMKDRRWFRRLCCFYKILNNQTPGYLYSLLVPPNRDYNTRRYTKFRQVFCRTETFSNSFLPQTIKEWNKLDTSICQAPSYSAFRKALLDFIRPTANSTFGTNDVSGLKLLTRLRVGFSHVREHKFKHNFQDTLNPLCPCSLEAEDTYHFFMRCQSFSNQRNVLFDDLNSINSEILKMSENEIVQVLLFGKKKFF